MTKPLIELSGLRMVYESSHSFMSMFTGRSGPGVTAVDGISLTVRSGETTAIVGESGSGKTTTGRIATLQERPTAGTVRFDGEDVTDLSGAALKRFRRQVQMIFQNPYEALDPRLTIGQSVGEPLRLHHLGSPGERRAKVLKILAEVELRPAEAYADRYPADLSGGQLQRAAIARALILEPKAVIADEPVSMLDVSVRSGVMNLMRALQSRMGMSYLYITHDLAVARYMANRIAVMYLGAIVEEGPTEQLIAASGHPYTRLLISAVPEHHQGARRRRVTLSGDALSETGIPAGCRFHTRCPMAQPVCRSVEPSRVSLGAGHEAACHFATDVARNGLTVAA
ncbi:ABC transporter ATP-binding protein [Microvirga antarctica]|uniref:ABC transporter ATP-binding protein n=1 Tax=Microvirga antarctica TaxID=2819233 RepID=UPI001B30D710|nr:oligopeptide/dipeptide ABC transporter ATP-binding protein [Microvirga antarctica]